MSNGAWRAATPLRGGTAAESERGTARDVPAYAVNVEVHAHAAALVVALLRAGELEAAESFVEWALENLDYDLEEMLDA